MTVRKLPVGIGISVGLHLAAVAWLATTGAARVLPAPHRHVVQIEIVPAPEPEPVAIALLVDPPPRAPDRPPDPPAVAIRTPSRTAPRTEASPPTTPDAGAVAPPDREPPAAGAGSATRSRFLTMRGPAIEHGLSQQWVDDFVARSKPLERPVEPSGELEPSGGGRHRSNQGPFRVDVDPDGAAHITDGPNFHAHITLPTPKRIGNALSAWAEDPYGDPAAPKRQIDGEYRVTGSDPKPTASRMVPIPVLGGGFDVSDALMRRHGQDPYASRKLRALDATRDERVQLGASYRREQLVKATQLIKASVDRLWASGLDVEARKRALFELWDDCAESGAPELIEAGQRARAFVVGFVNAKLPAGSAMAFSADELARLNAHRQSRRVFAPYGE